ncbi:hypothetical protein BC831DRAFT_474771 [Entophlyctis helioformis]|nr:hypothetical protein BC831DRAFT_474771 [Entophlyctis helioformis]
MEPQNQKYDRQLRLWQAHGQASLQQASICLIHGTALGAETLKNLVLPGIGSFTVVDDKPVTGADAGRNFFLTQDSIGKSRAETLASLLNELNEEVVGKAVVKNPVELIDSSPDFFRQFTLVIATELPEQSTLKLAQICWDAGIALIVAKVNGFFGYCRLVKNEHTIVEAHSGPISDFRFDCPFPALLSHVDSIDVATLDSMGSSHLPFVVILIKALAEWREKHNGALPSTSAEKQEFKDMVSRFKHLDSVDDENIAEARSNAYRTFSATKISSSIQSILNDPATHALTPNTPDFWLLVAALRDFVAAEGNGLLPVAGSLPDMKSDTDSFVKLQEIYRAKAREDQAAVRRYLNQILGKVGRPADSISDEDVARFCKNASALQVLRYRSIAQEHASSLAASVYDENGNLAYYWLFRAADRFWSEHGRLPGTRSNSTNLDEDAAALELIWKQLAKENSVAESSVSGDQIAEVVRAGGVELHNIASIMGGIVSQEIIKLLTSQYIPLNNTVVFNGINSTTTSFEV